MPDEEPKSAYELAMERLRRRDAEEGVNEPATTEAQKEQIAEARRVHAAKAAEIEILFKSTLTATLDPEARQTLQHEHRRDLERLQNDLEKKLAKIRAQ